MSGRGAKEDDVKRLVIALAVASAVLAATVGGASAAGRTFGSLYAHDTMYRTFGTPANVPAGTGTDAIVAFTNGAPGQLGVSAVAPGDRGYHGGRWAVWLATWNAGVNPRVLTDFEDVLAAQAAGELTLTRAAAADFRCPVLPGR